MSCRRYCDIKDCETHCDNGDVFSIDYDTGEFLKEHLSWMFDEYEDICQECMTWMDSSYRDIFLTNGDDFTINPKYAKNPELLEEKQ